MPTGMPPQQQLVTTERRQEPDQVRSCPWLVSALCSNHYGIDHGRWYADREIQLGAMVEFHSRFLDVQCFSGFRAPSIPLWRPPVWAARSSPSSGHPDCLKILVVPGLTA